ncbi:MAG: hypothetical protein JXA90_05345, partial [Planctomycetes bacterium]|nr:hypothetical protein [Planctomycetota bacterium]
MSASASTSRACLVAFLFFALCLAAPAWAENVIEIGYGEGTPGNSGAHVIVTARNDTPIHGYSLAISYPAEVLTLTSISVEGTHVRALEPDFVAPQIDTALGVATLGVIFDYDPPSGGSFQPTQLDALPEASSPIIIGRLSFHVAAGAPGGSYPIRLIDGLGSPPGYNRFTRAGESVVPRLVDGSFYVAGCDVLALEKKIALAGVTPSLPVHAYVQHCEPLAGFSITIGYKCSALTLVSAGYGQTYLGVTLGNQGLIDFFTTQVDDTIGGDYCRSVTAAVFEYP